MEGMSFKQHEIDYLNAADLGRLATVAPDGTPQNSPVGFTYNAELGTIDISGYHMSQSRKYRNIMANSAVAFVVDDIASRNPWRVRCLEIRGTADRPNCPPHRQNPTATHWMRRSSGSTRGASSASVSTTPKPSRICSAPTAATSVKERYSGQRMKSSCTRRVGVGPASSRAARTARKCAGVISSGGSSGWNVVRTG